jgi:L-amino acid N-acyltransferase YncA
VEGVLVAIRGALESDLGKMLEIYNDAVANSTATFDVVPRSIEQQRRWFAEHVPPYPAIVWEEEGRVLGWGSISPFRPKPAYRFSAELSVYVDAEARRRGGGETLLRELVRLGDLHGFHTLVGLITEENAASVALAEKVGFRQTGLLKEVGFKFGRWLNVVVLQRRCAT